MRYMNAMLLLVICVSIHNSHNSHNLLLYFVGFRARSTPKIANKNMQQRTLPDFVDHFPLLFTELEKCLLKIIVSFFREATKVC